MIRVKGTREGLVGKPTASGWVIDGKLPFVALPSTKALRKFVRVWNPANGKSCIAVVMDVGPWSESDDRYVFQPWTQPGGRAAWQCRPIAENGKDERGRLTNGAGIHLGEAVWKALEMADNGPVEWEFVE